MELQKEQMQQQIQVARMRAGTPTPQIQNQMVPMQTPASTSHSPISPEEDNPVPPTEYNVLNNCSIDNVANLGGDDSIVSMEEFIFEGEQSLNSQLLTNQL